MSLLPRPAPDDPVECAAEWIDAGRATGRRNPDAMALATCDAAGRPSVRMVLLKALASEGYAVFYTHYASRKGLELEANPHAAAAIYWPELGRQLRFEGSVERSPSEESDRYFESRSREKQISASVSEQSRPITDPDELHARAALLRDGLGGESSSERVERPPLWGGFRLWLSAIELWVEGTDRLHERLRYERQLSSRAASGFSTGPWRSEWLQP